MYPPQAKLQYMQPNRERAESRSSGGEFPGTKGENSGWKLFTPHNAKFSFRRITGRGASRRLKLSNETPVQAEAHTKNAACEPGFEPKESL